MSCAHYVLRFHAGGRLLDCGSCGVTWTATDRGFVIDTTLVGAIRTDPHTEFQREEMPTRPEMVDTMSPSPESETMSPPPKEKP